MAGLRVATVSTVALTTVGSLVAYGGLGNLIKDGVTTNFRAELFTASVLCVLLAVVLDVLLVLRAAGADPLDEGGRVHDCPLGRLGLPHRRRQLDRRRAGCSSLLVQQLLLTVTALALALAVGLPLALWLGHLGRGGFLAINVSNVGRAVPTFALLALLGDRGLAGHADVRALRPRRPGDADRAHPLRAAADHHQRLRRRARGAARTSSEAARGMGMTGRQQFFRVELPLALPLVVSGVRLALVQVWATATIAALVAGPGLGRVITDGFFRTNYGKGIAGAVVVAVVALVLELLAALAAARRRPSPDERLVTETGGGNVGGCLYG